LLIFYHQHFLIISTIIIHTYYKIANILAQNFDISISILSSKIKHLKTKI